MSCGVWRYHPTRGVFEPFAHGTTNPWGLDWDDYGQAFITNCVIDHLWHVVPGGHYRRMYGQDLNPYVYGLMGSCVDHLHWGGGDWTSSRTTGVGGKPEHSAAGGGHAHSGCSVYLGDNFPREYRNSVFMCNIHGNRLNRDPLERTPTGYVAHHGPDFLLANDAWFRGIKVKYGPDGGLYVCDWSDTGECHNYDKSDKTNGRVFKVVYGEPKHWSGDVAKLSDAELVKLQFHANDWFVRQARRVLQERTAAGKLEPDTVKALRKLAHSTDDVTWKLRAMWALHAVGGVTTDDLTKWLEHGDDNVRAWAFTLAGEPARPAADVIDALVTAAKREEAPFVLPFIAGACQRLPKAARLRLADALVWQVLDSDGHDLALATWYAVQSALATTDRPEDWSTLLSSARHPLIARNIARYLVEAAPPKERGTRLAFLVEYTKTTALGVTQLPVLAGVQDALGGSREYPEPAGWDDLYPELAASDTPEIRTRAEALAVLFGNAKAVADLKARAVDADADRDRRTAAIELLTRRKIAGFDTTLRELLTDPEVRGAAVRALAAYPDPKTPAAILAAYPSFTPEEKADAVQTLVSRPVWAGALLDAIEAEKSPSGRRVARRRPAGSRPE